MSPKYFVSAENMIASRRNANQTEAARREAEARKKIPQIAKALDKRYAAMTEFSSRVGTSPENPGNVREWVDGMARRNLAAQEEISRLLTNNRYPGDYLEPIFTCKKCRDTGIADNRYCECFMSAVKSFAAEDFNRESPVPLNDFSAFKLDVYPAEHRKKAAELLALCRGWAEDFHLAAGGLFLAGATGLGKTLLASCAAKSVADMGYLAVYAGAGEIFERVRTERYSHGAGGSDETMRLLLGCDLLLLDDLGAEEQYSNNSFYSSAVYNIINGRISRALPTIITTNLTSEEITKRYGERVLSRLMTFRILSFKGFSGADVRLKLSPSF